MSGRSLLLNLLQRGDEVSIELGRVVVQARSGKVVPKSWMKIHRHALAKAILCELGLDAFEYISFSTGFYGKNRHEGVTLQFLSVLGAEEAYTIFNAELTRNRTRRGGAKGSPLPAKHFRVTKRHRFYKFWQSTELSMPKSLASFHDFMGNLKDIFFTAHRNGERLETDSIKPLSVPARVVRESFMPDMSRINTTQIPDNCQIRMPDSDFHQSHARSGLQPNSGTGVHNHGNKVISKRENTGMIIPFPQQKTPEEMTVDEWADEFREAPGLPPRKGS